MNFDFGLHLMISYIQQKYVTVNISRMIKDSFHIYSPTIGVYSAIEYNHCLFSQKKEPDISLLILKYSSYASTTLGNIYLYNFNIV